MSRAAVSIDVRTLRPVVEALIFASEEPLPPRVLVRLLAGEREDPRAAADTAEELDSVNAATGAIGEESPVIDGGDAVAETTFAEEAVIDQVDSVDASGAGIELVEIDSASQSTASDAPRNGVEGWREEEIGMEGASESASDLADAYEDLNREYSTGMYSDEPVLAIDQRLVRRLVDELNAEYEESGRAFRIVEVAGGFQFATTRDYGEHVALLSKEKLRRRLSPAALETLAIIAFRQPISKPEIEAIRGVNSDQVLLSLLEKNLVCITGRSETVGRPLLYGTTDDFLRIFGLNTLNDLPKLREIEELMEDNAYSAERIEVVNVSPSSNAEEIEAMVGAAGHSENEEDGDDGMAIERDPNAVRIDRSGEPILETSTEATSETMNTEDDDELASDEEPFDDSAIDDDAELEHEPTDIEIEEAADVDVVFDADDVSSADGGLTPDSEAHALEEIDALEASDDAFDQSDTSQTDHA